MRVRVLPDVTLGHNDKTFTGGDELVLPGPTALSKAGEGYVEILGIAEKKERKR